jgi:hypothetical protein
LWSSQTETSFDSSPISSGIVPCIKGDEFKSNAFSSVNFLMTGEIVPDTLLLIPR